MTTDTLVNKSATTITVVDAPEISLAQDDKAGDLLLRFYKALGWNGKDFLDPSKIRTTKEVFHHLRNQMCELCSDPASVSMLMINSGPGTENYIPAGKVYLIEGWIIPDTEGGDDPDAA